MQTADQIPFRDGGMRDAAGVHVFCVRTQPWAVRIKPVALNRQVMRSAAYYKLLHITTIVLLMFKPDSEGRQLETIIAVTVTV